MKGMTIAILAMVSLASFGCANPSIKDAFPIVDIPDEYTSITGDIIQIDDCKGATIYGYYYFEKAGYEVYPISGNLEEFDETFMESNHTWLMVAYGDYWVAYDWGKPYFDEQHYEGYKVPIELLLIAHLKGVKN